MKTIAEHARDVMIETDNYGVGYGDSGLLDKIAERSGYARRRKKIRSPTQFRQSVHNRWDAVLRGIARRPDLFMRRKGFTNERVFWLRECLEYGEPQTPKSMGLKVEKSSE